MPSLSERKCRRFPPPWTIDDKGSCFIVKDDDGHALAYAYYENEPGRRSAANFMTRDEARRIAINIAKLPAIERLSCEPTDHCGGCHHLGSGRRDPCCGSALAAWSVAMAMTGGNQSHSLRVACIVDSVRPEFRFIA